MLSVHKITHQAVEGKDPIRQMIEERGMTYAIINNDLFDKLYCQTSVPGINYDKEKKEWLPGETTFNDLELITYIFIQFTVINKINLSTKEMADYIGCSDKQLKVVLKRLQHFKGVTNAEYNTFSDSVRIVEEKEVPLISVKDHTAYIREKKKSKKTKHYYTNFLPMHKEVSSGDRKIITPENFFIVTIEDFDLLTHKKLSKTEFITYLYLLKSFKSGAKIEKQVYWSFSKLAHNLNYRLVQTVHNHIEKLINLKLIAEHRPANYNEKVANGQEPSAKYEPVFNLAKLVEMSFEKEEVNSQKEEVNF
ncbi:hypothetical protein QUF79_14535 [Fictibacillus enclensis]|uniref:hypothetical protein n=1 Tax=Fictibacillus enclensis TaxID=1017270 RepID=UPI0025A0DBE1|nr:hypothetical protein [Fictibacillus enclensis]MDM5199235.1 hypothetical protein [Fictibacillus enclensis]